MSRRLHCDGYDGGVGLLKSCRGCTEWSGTAHSALSSTLQLFTSTPPVASSSSSSTYLLATHHSPPPLTYLLPYTLSPVPYPPLQTPLTRRPSPSSSFVSVSTNFPHPPTPDLPTEKSLPRVPPSALCSPRVFWTPSPRRPTPTTRNSLTHPHPPPPPPPTTTERCPQGGTADHLVRDIHFTLNGNGP